jgi:restriction system protein
MSRRQQSTLEDLIELSARFPWWLALVLAAVSYVVFHALSQLPVSASRGLEGLSGTMTSSLIRGAASALQYIAPVILSFGAVVSFLTGQRNRRLLAEAKQTAGTSDLQSLTWQDFEHLVGQAFRKRCFVVTETNTGPDGGIDLELRKDGELHLVQCKRWRARKVGVEIVRELYGVMSARGAVGGYVVSSGEFSDEAKRFAAGSNMTVGRGQAQGSHSRGVGSPSRLPASHSEFGRADPGHLSHRGDYGSSVPLVRCHIGETCRIARCQHRTGFLGLLPVH